MAAVLRDREIVYYKQKSTHQRNKYRLKIDVKSNEWIRVKKISYFFLIHERKKKTKRKGKLPKNF